MSNDATIAQTVHHLRKQLRLTQADAAHLAGISRRTWSDVELGVRRSSDATLDKIDVALKQEPGTLRALSSEPSHEDLKAMHRELVDMVAKITDREQLRDVLKFVTQQQLDALKARLAEYDHDSVAAR